MLRLEAFGKAPDLTEFLFDLVLVVVVVGQGRMDLGKAEVIIRIENLGGRSPRL